MRLDFEFQKKKRFAIVVFQVNYGPGQFATRC